jgi:acetate kinase
VRTIRRSATGSGRISAVLVVNAGSTSLKLSVVERDGAATTVESFDAVPEGVVAVAHRVVHGGMRFREPVVIDDAVEQQLEAAVELAPLHNAAALAAIEQARETLPDLPHVAVFDSAFHATIPVEAATYALPAEVREQWGIRRGSVDPGALIHLLEHHLTLEALAHMLEHDSGLAGLSGLSGDVRELEASNAPPARLALAVFTYRVATAVGAMATALGGLDALIFTAGIGENSASLRAAVSERLGFLGVELDAEANASARPDSSISAPGSAVRVDVI